MRVLALWLALLITTQADAIEIKQPDIEITPNIAITSPDDDVLTLGKIEYFIDIGAEHDTLFELKTRREKLTLKDGRVSTVFGYDLTGKVIVIGVAPITRISVTGADDKAISAIFYNANNEVIAPKKENIAVFDLDYNRKDFSYTPSKTPQGLTIDASILIDVSTSMEPYLQSVLDSTRAFLSSMPEFSHCEIYTFGSTVDLLTTQSKPCPNSVGILLSSTIKANGATALYRAIGTALKAKKKQANPHLIVVITDGVNTEKSSLTINEMISLKKKKYAKILVFGTGGYEAKHLSAVRDFEVLSPQYLKQDIDAFFHSIGVSVSGIQRLVL